MRSRRVRNFHSAAKGFRFLDMVSPFSPRIFPFNTLRDIDLRRYSRPWSPKTAPIRMLYPTTLQSWAMNAHICGAWRPLSCSDDGAAKAANFEICFDRQVSGRFERASRVSPVRCRFDRRGCSSFRRSLWHAWRPPRHPSTQFLDCKKMPSTIDTGHLELASMLQLDTYSISKGSNRILENGSKAFTSFGGSSRAHAPRGHGRLCLGQRFRSEGPVTGRHRQKEGGLCVKRQRNRAVISDSFPVTFSIFFGLWSFSVILSSLHVDCCGWAWTKNPGLPTAARASRSPAAPDGRGVYVFTFCFFQYSACFLEHDASARREGCLNISMFEDLHQGGMYFGLSFLVTKSSSTLPEMEAANLHRLMLNSRRSPTRRPSRQVGKT